MIKLKSVFVPKTLYTNHTRTRLTSKKIIPRAIINEEKLGNIFYILLASPIATSAEFTLKTTSKCPFIRAS